MVLIEITARGAKVLLTGLKSMKKDTLELPLLLNTSSFHKLCPPHNFKWKAIYKLHPGVFLC